MQVITVGPVVTVVGLLLIVGVLGVGVWALRHQKRQFPKGDQTGWTSGRTGAVSWLTTKFTWLSGGRG